MMISNMYANSCDFGSSICDDAGDWKYEADWNSPTYNYGTCWTYSNTCGYSVNDDFITCCNGQSNGGSGSYQELVYPLNCAVTHKRDSSNRCVYKCLVDGTCSWQNNALTCNDPNAVLTNGACVAPPTCYGLEVLIDGECHLSCPTNSQNDGTGHCACVTGTYMCDESESCINSFLGCGSNPPPLDCDG